MDYYEFLVNIQNFKNCHKNRYNSKYLKNQKTVIKNHKIPKNPNHYGISSRSPPKPKS